MSDIDKLIEAVEAGVDTAHHHAAAFPSETAYGKCTWHDSHKASSGSLDAAKALHEAMLPGWLIHDFSNTSRSMGWCMVICSPLGAYETSHHGSPNMRLTCPARSWLIAILKAYRSLQ